MLQVENGAEALTRENEVWEGVTRSWLTHPEQTIPGRLVTL